MSVSVFQTKKSERLSAALQLKKEYYRRDLHFHKGLTVHTRHPTQQSRVLRAPLALSLIGCVPWHQNSGWRRLPHQQLIRDGLPNFLKVLSSFYSKSNASSGCRDVYVCMCVHVFIHLPASLFISVVGWAARFIP